jgi:hypothetical protein
MAGNYSMFNNTSAISPNQIAPLMLSLMGVIILLTAGNFIAANTILKKKLNL